MSSSNNNKKNDDGGSKKKEPSDTLDEKESPALSTFQEGTQCDEEESSFLEDKIRIASRSNAQRQKKKNLAPTSSEKNDHEESEDVTTPVVAPPQQQACPGAFSEVGQPEPVALVCAMVVDNPELADAVTLDQEAIGRAYCERRLLQVLGIVLLIGMFVIGFFLVFVLVQGV